MRLAHEASEFERRVLPHLDAAYNLARWLVRDPAAAEDVVQEAMLRALRYHAGLRGDAKPWLLQIVRNVAYAAIESRRKFAEVSLDGNDQGCSIALVDQADDPEAALARQQDLHHLDRSLAALPDELRECLVLRELEALSYKEIALVTGVAIGTVMSRLWRARQALLEGSR
jgi:RNA polymerase sigma factor (sigma-70 family)